MTNNDFETRMNAVLDERGQLLADERLRSLSREDSQSRELLDSYRSMLEGIDSAENPPAPKDMAQRVLAEFARPVVVRSSPMRRVVALAAVAAALLAAVAWWQFESRGQVKMASTITNDKVGEPLADQKDGDASPAPNAAEASEEDPQLGTMVRDSSEAYAQLVRDTQASMADLALLFPGVGQATLDSSTPKESPTDVDPSAEGSASPGAAGWMDQMSDGLRPFTSATSGAFNVLLRSLPSEVNDSDS